MNSITKFAFYPLLVILLSAIFQFYKYVLQIYPGVISHQLMSEFHLSGAGLGNLAATFYYTFIITQLFVGFLLDRYRVRWITSSAILLCAIGVILFSFSHSSFSACLSRALIGIGVAFSSIAYMKLATEWFSEKSYALVTGLLASATMFGAVFGQLPLSFLINLIGWRSALFILGFCGLILTSLYVMFVRDKKIVSNLQTFSFSDVKEVFKNKQNWLLMFYGGLAFSPLSVFAGLWGNSFLQQAYHFNQIETAGMISIIFTGLGLGSPLLGYLASKVENKLQLMLYGTLVAFVSLTLILFIQPLPKIFLEFLLFIFGFALGSYLLVFTLGKELNKLAVAATVFAMINAGDPLFTGITEPLIGVFLDFSWNGKWVDGARYFTLTDYRMGLIILPLYLIVATILLLVLKRQSKSNYSYGYKGQIKIRQITDEKQSFPSLGTTMV